MKTPEAAADFSALNLDAAVVVAFARSPTLLAYQALDAQVASNGRFELGLGWGSVDPEFETYGITPSTRAERVDRLRLQVDDHRVRIAVDAIDRVADHASLRALVGALGFGGAGKNFFVGEFDFLAVDREFVFLGLGLLGRFFLYLDGFHLSHASRELRALAARGRSLRYLVPDAVADFIRREGLYRGRPELVLERPVEVDDVPVDPAT